MTGVGWLDEVEQRIEGATEGPWEAVAFDSGHSKYEMSVSVATADTGDRVCDMDGLGRWSNDRHAKDDGSDDATFIAASRTDLPRAVGALRAVLELHQPTPDDAADAGHCTGCDSLWPCPTVAAIEGCAVTAASLADRLVEALVPVMEGAYEIGGAFEENAAEAVAVLLPLLAEVIDDELPSQIPAAALLRSTAAEVADR